MLHARAGKIIGTKTLARALMGAAVFGALFVAFQFGPNDITMSNIVNIVKIQEGQAVTFFETFSTAAAK